jgi:hypothetical protein
MSFVKGGVADDIGGNKDLFGDLAGTVPVQAVVRPDGRMAAVFLPVNETRQAAVRPALEVWEAAEIAFNLFIRSVDADLMNESFPVDVAGLGDPKIVFATALSVLKGQAEPTRMEAAEPVPSPGGEEKKPAEPKGEPTVIEGKPLPDRPPVKMPGVREEEAPPPADETW